MNLLTTLPAIEELPSTRSYNSKRRKAVIDAIESIGRPFTAIQLWQYSRHFDDNSSRATVYRILRNLRDEGFIKDVILPHGLRVSVHTNADAYCILECEDCGRFQMDLSLAEKFAQTASDSDILLRQAAIYIRGRCRERCEEGRCVPATAATEFRAVRS